MFRFRDKYTIDQLRSKVYAYHINYNKFNDINEKRYEVLKKQISDFMVRMSHVFGKCTNKDRYYELLGYISHKVEYNHAPYDERILMLIEACDPDYVHYKSFLTVEHDQDYIKNLANTVRKEVGFYDPKFINYEAVLFSKFKKNNELLHGVKEDYSDFLYKYLGFVKTLDNIDEERYEEIVELVNKWKDSMQENDGYLTAIYHLLFQSDLLGVKGSREKLVFLIEALDKNLDMLDAYYNNSREELIEEEAKETVGFYAPEFIDLEKVYAKRFAPSMANDPWGSKKNTR